MTICYCCKKIIKGGYFSKYFKVDTDANGLPVYEAEPVCKDCAATMIDEHTNNGLLIQYQPEEVTDDIYDRGRA